jgi:uncharacterized protein (DUF924 family)
MTDKEYVLALRQRIAQLEDELAQCLDFIKSHMEVIHRPSGRHPNRAMQLVNTIDESLHGRGQPQ